MGEGGGSIRCRASSGEPTQEAPEKQGKSEETVYDEGVEDSDEGRGSRR